MLPFEADIEKATNEMSTQEDWAVIMDLCDKVSQNNGSRDCLRALMKRINHKVPRVSQRALVVLDACINNCGRPFHLEVSSKDFVSDARSFLSNKNAHPKVQQKFRAFIKKWAEMPEFKDNSSLSLFTGLYKSLKDEGVDFSDPESSPASRSSKIADVEKEENELAKAIELSLQDVEKTQTKTSPLASTSSMYPSVYSTPYQHSYTDNAPRQTEARNVRALYDFEAAEDNELTFKAGEIVIVTDDGDPNWWRGYNHRGEGLFPANFVSADLSVEPEHSETKKVQFNEVVEVKTLQPPPEVVEIEENKIDECLHLIQNADPTGANRPDSDEMFILEEQCKAMGPLIDTELEKIDTKHANLVGVNSKVMEALQMYHILMRESYGVPKAGPPLGMGPQVYLPQQMYQAAQPSSIPQEMMYGQGQGPQPEAVPTQHIPVALPPAAESTTVPEQVTSTNVIQTHYGVTQQNYEGQSADPQIYQTNYASYYPQQNPYHTASIQSTSNLYQQPLI